jgi:hypothetical protein
VNVTELFLQQQRQRGLKERTGFSVSPFKQRNAHKKTQSLAYIVCHFAKCEERLPLLKAKHYTNICTVAPCILL